MSCLNIFISGRLLALPGLHHVEVVCLVSLGPEKGRCVLLSVSKDSFQIISMTTVCRVRMQCWISRLLLHYDAVVDGGGVEEPRESNHHVQLLEAF